MKRIRSKETGKIFEIMEGALYPEDFYEEIKDDDIKVGKPKVEFEIEETPEEQPKKVTKKVTKKAKKGAKKNDKKE